MFSFFRAMLDRFKAAFVTQAALDLEAEILSYSAERGAELHRRARQYEKEGLHGIAHFLRKQANELSSERPLAGVLVTVSHVQGNSESQKKALPLPRHEFVKALPEQTPKAPQSNQSANGFEKRSRKKQRQNHPGA